MAKAHLLENKVAIVTGGGAGIGYAVAKDSADLLSTYSREL